MGTLTALTRARSARASADLEATVRLGTRNELVCSSTKPIRCNENRVCAVSLVCVRSAHCARVCAMRVRDAAGS